MRALVESRSCRCNPTSYSCNWKALSQNSHWMSEPPEECCWVLGIAWSSAQNSWLITSVATFTSETLSVRHDNECIHYSSPLGLGTDQYAGPIKSHRRWMLRLLAAGQANKVPLRNRDGFFDGEPMHCEGGVCVCLKDTSLVWTIGNACRQGHFL